MVRWCVVIPVKRLALAKSRLRGATPGVPHDDLVLALAADTVAASLSTPSVAAVLVVTDEPVVRDAVRELGAVPVPDGPDAGLNPALSYGADQAVRRSPGTAVAVLGADLPALRPPELAAALEAAEAYHRAYVTDAAGTGTSLLTARDGRALGPRFGPGSAAAHAGSGAVELTGDWPSLRRDVDTAEQLRAAYRLGLGARTSALIGSTARP